MRSVLLDVYIQHAMKTLPETRYFEEVPVIVGMRAQKVGVSSFMFANVIALDDSVSRVLNRIFTKVFEQKHRGAIPLPYPGL